MEHNPPSIHRQVEDERACIQRAQAAVSESAWVVGECAYEWTKQWSRGRTDADFGLLVGLSGDEIYKRRRVWEVFGETASKRNLSFTHHYVAMNWEDANECLEWAEENEASVAEMKAWRRAVHGEDLTTESDDDLPDDEIDAADVPAEDYEPYRDPDPPPPPPTTTVPTPKGPSEQSAEAVKSERSEGASDPPRATGATQPSPVEPEPKRGDTAKDKHGFVTVMAVADGYVMARRPGATPFVKSVKDWYAIALAALEAK